MSGVELSPVTQREIDDDSRSGSSGNRMSTPDILGQIPDSLRAPSVGLLQPPPFGVGTSGGVNPASVEHEDITRTSTSTESTLVDTDTGHPASVKGSDDDRSASAVAQYSKVSPSDPSSIEELSSTASSTSITAIVQPRPVYSISLARLHTSLLDSTAHTDVNASPHLTMQPGISSFTTTYPPPLPPTSEPGRSSMRYRDCGHGVLTFVSKVLQQVERATRAPMRAVSRVLLSLYLSVNFRGLTSWTEHCIEQCNDAVQEDCTDAEFDALSIPFFNKLATSGTVLSTFSLGFSSLIGTFMQLVNVAAKPDAQTAGSLCFITAAAATIIGAAHRFKIGTISTTSERRAWIQDSVKFASSRWRNTPLLQAAPVIWLSGSIAFLFVFIMACLWAKEDIAQVPFGGSLSGRSICTVVLLVAVAHGVVAIPAFWALGRTGVPRVRRSSDLTPLV